MATSAIAATRQFRSGRPFPWRRAPGRIGVPAGGPMSKRSIGLSPKLSDYVLSTSLRETEPLRRLREETASMPMAGMQIAPEQGQFMALLARLIGAKQYLEIGTFTGYSTLAVALALPFEGRVLACDVNPETTAVAQRYWTSAGVAGKIELRLAPAIETLDKLIAQGQAGRFDLAFIDADKENYDAYYERVLRLVRPGGVILIDNVLWGGDVADPRKTDAETMALRALNEKLHGDERVDLSLLPLADGLTLLRKR
jgi:predicted O-methyltransferase YrrM